MILRYFNPAGAHFSNLIGESSFGRPVYLVPVIMETASGKRDEMFVHGIDYETRDGSCIRDFIHIMDLANAHTKAITYIHNNTSDGDNYEVFNLGAGNGVSILEMINAFEKETEIALNYKIGPRRSGDVVAIYSNFEKAEQKLGWRPQYDVNDIMRTAWAWEQKNNL